MKGYEELLKLEGWIWRKGLRVDTRRRDDCITVLQYYGDYVSLCLAVLNTIKMTLSSAGGYEELNHFRWGR